MAKWFNVARQSIYNVLNNKPSKRYAKWTGFVLSPYEYSILDDMTSNAIFNYQNEDVVCYIFNDRRSDIAVIFAYNDIIKCFFLNELPEQLQYSIVSKKMNSYSESEMKGESNGRVVKCLKKPFFVPYDSIKFRNNARARSMSTEEYSIFISGYPLKNTLIDDNRIIQHLKDNMIDGQVYISSDPKHQWLRTVAYRNNFGIADLIRFYGFEPYQGDRKDSATRERHINELQKHIIKDNVVYFSAATHAYNIISTYCTSNQLNIDNYIESLGFKRTLQKPKQEYDVDEPDMQIRSVEGNAEDIIFAKYPLIGSRVFSDKEITIINDSAAKCLEHVIKDPQTKLTLQAEMRITLAVINYAKNWKSEEKGKFWEYIAFQFGYRSKEGSMVCKILQNSIENALKKNNRLFIENENSCIASRLAADTLKPDTPFS